MSPQPGLPAPYQNGGLVMLDSHSSNVAPAGAAKGKAELMLGGHFPMSPLPGLQKAKPNEC